jgi:hypothetical protein
MTDFVRDSVDLESIISCIIKSIDEASSFDSPFLHLTLNDVFPNEIFAAMLESMPVTSDYRPMSGRSRTHDLADGTHTRIKLDLFPELIRHLPEHKQKIWILVGQALRSAQVQDTFVRRLTPTLAKQHGQRYSVMDLYPVPSLTCDSTGYAIPIHTDTHWKGITVQLYLPPDDTLSHIGTVFHEKCKNGSFLREKQMRFIPNSGYAFAVSNYSWHSADKVGAEVSRRDSILLTYFIDDGLFRKFRNRSKRFGNFILNEIKRKFSLP